ncbi:MAG TPA: glycosyltransferase [Candidatus Baltobacteraceae bacterium]|jgi:glycosyltransferase involved in cell wall biosynthesis|nr:glycosyltransferase [Candidatus Baltobacteraceae bacterium]
MKRVLLIAYVFPPDASPGAQRPGFIAKYLPQFGWDAAPLTRSLDAPAPPLHDARASADGTAHDSRVRALLRGVRDSMLVPDRMAPWIPGAIAYGRKLLASQSFDAILGTALPASVHVVGGALARMSGLPWIADYRDPWSGNRYAHHNAVRSSLEAQLERRLISRAACITTVSGPIADRLAAFHGRRDVHVIPNAYDPSEWSGLAAVQPAEFSLCYTGSMYDGLRTPDLLFSAIAILRGENHPAGMNARVHFFGPDCTNVIPCARKYGIEDAVRYHGAVPRAQALRAQRESAALVIFLNMDPQTAGELGSKYLEYAGARRHILAFGPAGSALRGVLAESGAGSFASNSDQAAECLKGAYMRFLRGEHDVAANAQAFPTGVELAGRFAQLLDRYAAAGSAARVA